MKKILLIVSFFALNANAELPFFSGLNKMHVKEALNCTDFSGQWMGKCNIIHDGSNSTIDINFTLEMWGCSSISLDKQFYLTDGVKNTVDSAKDGVSSSTDNLTWNDQNKKEFLKFSSSSQFTDFISGSKTSLTRESVFKILNNKLLIEHISTLNGKDSVSNSCELTKK